MTETEPMTPAQETERYILAGNATFTLVSRKTNDRFTFKVTQAKSKPGRTKPVWWVKARVGAEYTLMGVIGIVGPNEYAHSVRSPIDRDEPISKAFRWFMKNLASSQVELHKSNRCCACGRALTTPESIAKGIGPDCEARSGW